MMKNKDIALGKTYLVLVSNQLSPVIIGSRAEVRGWKGTNLATRKSVWIKTASKCRRELTGEQIEKMILQRSRT